MVSKIREATIDMGPQPVKYSKFSPITRSSLLKIVPVEAIEIFSSLNQEDNFRGKNDLIHCLFVVTDIAFELWILKSKSLSNKHVEMECIYKKQEHGIELIDFVHIYATE